MMGIPRWVNRSLFITLRKYIFSYFSFQTFRYLQVKPCQINFRFIKAGKCKKIYNQRLSSYYKYIINILIFNLHN